MNPYLPSTETERLEMLQAAGARSVEDLLAQIPEALRWRDALEAAAAPGGEPSPLARPLGEMELVAEARRRAEQNAPAARRVSFLGAGCYRHYVPAVVPQLALRSEFLTAYTPYQPEASQGLLQAFFEFQTFIARLTEMEVSNAGLYDGATALAEAALMAMSVKPAARRLVISRGVHPNYRQVVRATLEGLNVEIVEAPLAEGRADAAAWQECLGAPGTAAAAVFQSPNFLGSLEEGAALAEAAHRAGALAVQVFNPIALGRLAAPGQWGVDIAVGEGQPLGLGLGAGGASLGLFATRNEFVWKMPGRLVGLTRDHNGRRAYTLTLQSREQHIRRARATSNICTNHALYALMAAIYLAALGAEGLRELAELCVRRAALARQRLAAIPGCRLAFPQTPVFHEFVLDTGQDARALAARLAQSHNLLAGYPLGDGYPELRNALLVCVTEMTSGEDIETLASALASAAKV